MIEAHTNRALWIGCLWPVPTVNGHSPAVSHEFEPGERYLPNGNLNYAVHLGVDIMFRRQAGDPPSRSRFVSFDDVRIMATVPGNVWDAGETKLGHFVEIDHGKVGGVGMLTFYQHMSRLERPWKKGDAVFPGMPLGVMGADPTDPEGLVHLHFEVWLPDGKPKGKWSVDPQPYLDRWVRL